MLGKVNHFLHKLFLSKLAFEIWVSFKYYPEDWSDYDNGYHVQHKTSKVALWTGNGGFFFNIEHKKDHSNHKLIGYLDRHVLWWAFKVARKKINNLEAEYIELFSHNKNRK